MSSIENFKSSGLQEKIKSMGLNERMELLFSAFRLGKNEEENEKRKKDFTYLMGRYFNSLMRSEKQSDIQEQIAVKDVIISDQKRKKAHAEIMLTIRKTAITLEANRVEPLMHALFDFLGKDQKEVERLVVYYFTGKDITLSKSAYISAKQGIDSINNKVGPEEE